MGFVVVVLEELVVELTGLVVVLVGLLEELTGLFVVLVGLLEELTGLLEELELTAGFSVGLVTVEEVEVAVVEVVGFSSIVEELVVSLVVEEVSSEVGSVASEVEFSSLEVVSTRAELTSFTVLL